MGRQHTDPERRARHRQGQRNIRRRCICGRVIVGNAAWWSHTHTKDGEERKGHSYGGRA